MPRSSSKAPATISTPPPDKVVGGPRVIADVSDCANNVIASVNDECIDIVSVPVSSVQKDIEKPFCGPSESVSPLTGDRAELFNDFLAFMDLRDANLKRSASKLQDVYPTRPSSTMFRKGPATPSSETLPAVPISASVAETSLDPISELHPSRFSLRHGTFGTPRGIDPRGVLGGDLCDVRTPAAAPPLTTQGGGFSHMPIYSINSSRAVPVSGDQSGSVCRDADVDFNFSDIGISENETDTDAPDYSLSAVAIDREARVLLRRYMGDLFDSGRGETVEPNTMKGFFARKPLSDPGIALPPELADTISSFDNVEKFLPGHDDTEKTFRFRTDDNNNYFRPKRLAPHTLAFANSLGNAKVNSLTTKEFKTLDRKWSFIETAASTGERIALYSILLADLLGRSTELQVTEDDCILIQNLLYYTQFLSLSQFTRTTAFAIEQRRALVADTLSPLASAGLSENPLPKKVARNSPFLFGGKFLDNVNESLSVQKTADEVASRCKKSRKNVRGSAPTFQRQFRGANRSFRGFRGRNLSRGGRPRSGRGGFRGVNKDTFGSKNKASQNK